MTICIAAICEDLRLVGASDRMMTAGDIQFEPMQTKVGTLTNAITIMIAGDVQLQAEIIQKLRSEIAPQLQDKPEDWLNVYDIAELYQSCCDRTRRHKAEHALLAPLGLTNETFVTRQKEMEPSFVRHLATELLNYEAPSIEAIICGIDPSGPHIYVIDEEDGVSCRDYVGFAAIGAGMWHASSQFMVSGHTTQKRIPETILLTYLAKKRAEVAPGVGEATDMFVNGPELGSWTPVPPFFIDSLEDIHISEQEKIRVATEDSIGKIDDYINKLSQATAAQAQSTEAKENEGGDTSTNEEDI